MHLQMKTRAYFYSDEKPSGYLMKDHTTHSKMQTSTRHKQMRPGGGQASESPAQGSKASMRNAQSGRSPPDQVRVEQVDLSFSVSDCCFAFVDLSEGRRELFIRRNLAGKSGTKRQTTMGIEKNRTLNDTWRASGEFATSS